MLTEANWSERSIEPNYISDPLFAVGFRVVLLKKQEELGVQDGQAAGCLLVALDAPCVRLQYKKTLQQTENNFEAP